MIIKTLIAQGLDVPGLDDPVQGPLGPELADLTIAGIVSKLLDIVFPIAGIALLVFIVWGGFDYMTSMGDPKKAAAARTKMTSALIGFIIIIAAYFIVRIVDSIFGLGVYS